jgi:hypothetical protein
MKKYLELGPALPFTLSAIGTFMIGDIDGDQRYETILMNPTNQSLTILSYFSFSDIDAQWPDTASGQLLSIYTCVQNIPAAAGVSTGWHINTDDQYYTADLDHDGKDEIFVYSPSQGMGVLQWDGQRLQTLWSSANPLKQWAAVWPGGLPLNSVITFYVLDVDGDGSAEIMVYIAQQRFLGLLKWQNSALIPLWNLNSQNFTVTGGLVIQTWDQFFPARLGAANGDTCDQIVVFSANDGYLVVLGWDSTRQDLVIVGQSSHSTISDPSNPAIGWWLMSPGDHLLISDIDGDGNDELIIIEQYYYGMGVFAWRDLQIVPLWINRTFFTQELQIVMSGNVSSFAAKILGRAASEIVMFYPNFGQTMLNSLLLQWQGSSMISLGTGSPNLSVTDPIVMSMVDVNGDGADECVVFDMKSAAVGFMEWANNQPAFAWGLQSSPKSWNLDLIANAPTNSFIDFSGAQLEVYQKIGPALTPPTSIDLRSEYTNPANQNNFSNWATQLLESDPSQPAWQWMSAYSANDIKQVTATLAQELGAVSTVYSQYAAIYQSLLYIPNQQDIDLAHCVEQIVRPPSPSSPIVYWLGALIDAALWGVAAIPGMEGMAVILATWASLAGSVFGTISTGNPGTTVEYLHLQEKIDEDYKNSNTALATQQTLVVKDRFKLIALNALWQGAWRWNLQQAGQVAANGQNGNRICFYKMLLPQAFYIGFYDASQYNYPTYISRNMYLSTTKPLNCPSYAYMQEPLDHGTYNVFLWCTSSDLATLEYPTNDLVTELFTTLNVPQIDFYYGNNGWTLPRFDGSALSS